MTTIEALKNLAIAFGCCTELSDMDGIDTVPEIIMFIANNWTPQ